MMKYLLLTLIVYMEQTYTDDSLIRLIYGETSIPERFEMEYAIENDSNLRATFQRLYWAYKSLPKVLFRPSQRVMRDILMYSSSFSA